MASILYLLVANAQLFIAQLLKHFYVYDKEWKMHLGERERNNETTVFIFRDNRSSWVVLSKHLLKNKDKDLFSKRKISKRNLNFNSKFSVLKQAATKTADLDWWILITSKEKGKEKE